MSNEDFPRWMRTQQQYIETILTAYLPPESNNILAPAMRYAVLGHGKRIRPLLILAAAKISQCDTLAVEHAICAIEFMHSYSLVHDDMPCMDNDDLRHGKPTCHKIFGDATALLVGDGLQTLSFEVLSKANSLPAKQNLQAIQLLAVASGCFGMAEGQALDLMHTGKEPSLEELELMHRLKTGALIECAVSLGSLAAIDFNPAILLDLQHYAQKIGLAFQIIDDILDYEADSQTLGKTAGKDLQNNKATFVSLMGIPAAKNYAQSLIEQAIKQVSSYLPASQNLIEIAQFIYQRQS